MQKPQVFEAPAVLSEVGSCGVIFSKSQYSPLRDVLSKNPASKSGGVFFGFPAEARTP